MKTNDETIKDEPEKSCASLQSDSEEDWIYEDFQPKAFFLFRRDERPRKWFIKLVTWTYFEKITIGVILVNCVSLGMYDPYDPHCESHTCKVLDKVELVIYTYFLLEMLAKWMAMGLFGNKGYFKETWNRLDFFIVAAGTFELSYGEGEFLSAVRAVRVLRPLRAINRVPSIRILVTLLLDTLPMLGNVLAICFLIFAIFGIVGVQMWQGVLRGRCQLQAPNNSSSSTLSYNLSNFYIPNFEEDYICSLDQNNGMKTCNSESFQPFQFNGLECSQTFEEFQNLSSRTNYTNACVNWNLYYTKCTLDGHNPFWDAISFDNIAIAWVAIFQVITLEGWTDIMYFVQDAYGFWNWIYFVFLIVLGSYFMTNLCLVVITTQFQETKQRESALMKTERRKRRMTASSSTVFSSKSESEGCYTEILKYIEHLCRRFKRRFMRRFNIGSSQTKTQNIKMRKKKRKNKAVHHHHHYHHHYHHHHHHVHCAPDVCQCGGAVHCVNHVNYPSSPALSDEGVGSTHLQTNDHSPLQSPARMSPRLRPETTGFIPGSMPDKAPVIAVYAGSTATIVSEPSPVHPTLITKTHASASVNGNGAVSDIFTSTELPSPTASDVVAAAATSSLEIACACAVEHLGKVERDAQLNSTYMYATDDDEETEAESGDEDETVKPKGCKRFRKIFRSFVECKYFMYMIMAAIFLNTLTMGVEYHGQPDKMTEILKVFNYFFTAVFGIEMVCKLLAYGAYGYIKDPYNLFDGTIVIISVIEVFQEGEGGGISVLRSFRLLRVFKLVRFLPALRRQLLVMVRTMDNVMTFLALLTIFIFTASILGMHLFGAKLQFMDENGEMVVSRANFDTLFWALVTVFQILTQEDWNAVMYDGMRSTTNWAALYFILLMTIGNYILFNLLVAILVEGFANQPGKNDNTSESSNSKDEDKEKEPLNEKQIVCLRGNNNQSIPQFYIQRASIVSNSEHLNGKQRVIVIPGDSNDPENWPEIHLRSCENPECTEPTVVFTSSEPMSPAETLQVPQPMSRPDVVKTKDASTETTNIKKKLADEIGHKEEQESSEIKTGHSSEAQYDVTDGKSEERMDSMERGEEVLNYSKVFVKESPPSCLEARREYSLYLLSPSNWLRMRCMWIYTNPWFDRLILLFILFNCVVMALERPDIDPTSWEREFLDTMNYVFLGVFTLEMAIKVLALGFYIGDGTYLRNGWNVMDGFLVGISWVDFIVSQASGAESSILGVLRVFRAFRTLRPLRVISRAPGLKIVVETLISSLKPIGNIVLIAATFFIIFGILGVQLFKGKFWHCEGGGVNVVNKTECIETGGSWQNNEYNFDNLAKALLTLFVFATKDGWVTIMYSGIDAVAVDKEPQRDYNKFNVIYFVAFLLLAGFVVLNMLVGVVVENFQKCRDEIEKEKNSEEMRKERKNKALKMLDDDREFYEHYSSCRKMLYYTVTNSTFDIVIAVIIGLNVICMAMEHYQQIEEVTMFLTYANYVFTAIFILEALLKVPALGCRRYFRDRWNVLDIVIVVLSIVGILLEELNTMDLPINPTIIRVMRVLRIARVLKLLKTAEGIRSLLDTVAKALPQVANLAMLFMLLFFIFGALGMELFGKINCDIVACSGMDEHAHFRHFGYAMLTLFRISTGDNWNGILKDTINTRRCKDDPFTGCDLLEHISPIYFAMFVLATQFVLLNVVVAVLMKHLEESRDIESDTMSFHAPEIETSDELNGELNNKNNSLQDKTTSRPTSILVARDDPKYPKEKLERKVSFDERSVASRGSRSKLNSPSSNDLIFDGDVIVPDNSRSTVDTSSQVEAQIHPSGKEKNEVEKLAPEDAGHTDNADVLSVNSSHKSAVTRVDTSDTFC